MGLVRKSGGRYVNTPDLQIGDDPCDAKPFYHEGDVTVSGWHKDGDIGDIPINSSLNLLFKDPKQVIENLCATFVDRLKSAVREKT